MYNCFSLDTQLIFFGSFSSRHIFFLRTQIQNCTLLPTLHHLILISSYVRPLKRILPRLKSILKTNAACQHLQKSGSANVAQKIWHKKQRLMLHYVLATRIQLWVSMLCICIVTFCDLKNIRYWPLFMQRKLQTAFLDQYNLPTWSIALQLAEFLRVHNSTALRIKFIASLFEPAQFLVVAISTCPLIFSDSGYVSNSKL